MLGRACLEQRQLLGRCVKTAEQQQERKWPAQAPVDRSSRIHAYLILNQSFFDVVG
jgi:hypothetical protein